MKLLLVVGARPNLVKAAALLHAFRGHPVLQTTLVHTGQHYDEAMSGAFLRELDVPNPDFHLRVGSGTHAVQTGRIMMRLERLLLRERPDRLIVVGDVNSTLAAALVAAKLRLPVDHVEAGLRSGDRDMPEEINRIVTDSLASLLFVSEPAGLENLSREGRQPSDLHHVGNVMIDTLERILPVSAARAAWREHGFDRGEYGVLTLHRPSNVDEEGRLRSLLEVLDAVSGRIPLIFPVHPRTRPRLERLGAPEGLRLCDPLGYIEFLSLLHGSRLVITDSGGVQEETTAIGIPCLTLRTTTERPVTVSLGTNTLLGADPARLPPAVDEILTGAYRKGTRPPLWDGHAADRIARILVGQAEP